MNCYLAEITHAIDAAGTTLVFRASNAEYNTRPSDNPANTHYANRVKQPGLVRRDMFSSGKTSGRTSIGHGQFVFVNADGAYDYLLPYAVDGRSFVLKYGDSAGSYSSFTTVLKGTMEQADYSEDFIYYRVKDKLYVYDNPLAQTLYAGTNAAPAGVEGLPADIKGQVKPIILGSVLNITPVLVNSSRLIYQVSNFSVADISNVYDKGLALTRGADYPDLATMDSVGGAPAAGQYRVWPQGGYFRLGSSPAGQITCDAKSNAGNLVLYSESMANAAWTKGNFTVSTGAIPAGDAYPVLDGLIENTTPSVYHYMGQAVAKPAVALPYTASAFVASSAGREVYIYLVDGANGCYVYFDPNTGTLGTPVAFGAGFNTLSANAYLVAPGIYHLFLSAITTASAVVGWQVASSVSAAGVYTGDGVSGIYIGGAQIRPGFERGAYAKTTSAARTTATVATQLVEAALLRGLDRADLKVADVAALDALNNAEVGIFVSDENSALNVMDELAQSIGAWYGFDALGRFRMGQLLAPSGTPALTLNEYQIILETGGTKGIRKVTPRDETNGLPTYRYTLKYQKNCTVQDSDIAGAVTDARRAFLKLDYRSVVSEDASIKTQYLTSTPIERQTLLTDATAAATEAARLLALFKVRRNTYEADVRLDSATLAALDLGVVVNLVYPRFDLATGKLFVVLGFEADYQDNSAKLTLWG